MSVHFLGSSLAFMMVYVWGRRNRYERMSFLGLFPFTAPYLPWVLFSFSVLLGHMWTTDAIGMVVGHLYYYLEDVYPALADARGWKRRKLLVTPSIVCVSRCLFCWLKSAPHPCELLSHIAAGTSFVARRLLAPVLPHRWSQTLCFSRTQWPLHRRCNRSPMALGLTEPPITMPPMTMPTVPVAMMAKTMGMPRPQEWLNNSSTVAHWLWTN